MPSETIDSLDVSLTNLIDLSEYPECCNELFKIQPFKYAVKYFEACQWPCEQESRLKYTLLHYKAQLHERSIAEYTQETTKSRCEVKTFLQSLEDVHRNKRS